MRILVVVFVAVGCGGDPPLADQLRGVGVEVDGFGTCDGAFTLPVPPFAELRLRALDGAPSRVSGACDRLPCTLYADTRELAVDVAY